MNIYWKLGIAVLIFLAGFGLGSRLKQGEWDADVLAKNEKAAKVEASWMEDIAIARSTRDDQINTLNNRLADALERLRKRPERLPEAARKTCEGSTGRELSGPDAAFLERLAARAEQQRIALQECYAWNDTVTQAK